MLAKNQQKKGGFSFHSFGTGILHLRSRRPGTGPRNGNSRKVLAGVLAQVLAKMGVLAEVLAQVLAGRALWENRDKAACQHLCQHSGQHPHFCQHLCQHPRQHFSGIPFSGSCTRLPGSQALTHKSTLDSLGSFLHSAGPPPPKETLPKTLVGFGAQRAWRLLQVAAGVVTFSTASQRA